MKWASTICALALTGRCMGGDSGTEEAPIKRAPPPASAVKVDDSESFSFIQNLTECDVDHEGVFLDVGSPAVDARRDHLIGRFDVSEVHERGGASFARVHGRRLAFDFALLEPLHRGEVSVRALGVASRSLNVYVDDRRLGFVTLSRDDPKVASLPVDELAAGPHTVTLRFSGGVQGADEPYAEVDFIRIGRPLEPTETYAPPTLRDIVTDVVLSGVPRRSIVLRSPSSVRCTLRAGAGMKFSTGAGYWGNGTGVARIRVIEDGEPPRVVAEKKVTGGATWTPISLDLEPYAGRIVAVELSAMQSSGSGRVAFGEPMTLAAESAPAPQVRPAAVVVVAVLSGLDRRMVPPWGPAEGMPTLARIARDGVAFDRYRAPTSVVPAVFASLLSGLPPRAHGLEDPSSRLSGDVRVIGERVKEGSVHSALFTGVPLTFPAFGFDRGWDQYDAISPVKDLPAAEPLTRGAAWLSAQITEDRDAKVLLVVHGRGGHPPWDVTRDEVAVMPPEEYAGALEPRAGAIVLSNLRAQKRGAPEQRLTGGDWRRLHALEEAGLAKQDAGLRRIVEVLDREDLYTKSLLVVMGDVSAGDPPGVPFAPMPSLREDVLLTPLLVKFPAGTLAATHASAMATTTDVTETLLRALGVGTEGVEGTDLARLARGDLPIDGHPSVATLGTRFSTRFGPWLLSGDFGRRPALCQADVDPSCATDVHAQSPLAAEALWRRTFQATTTAMAARGHRAALPAVFDGDTAAALKVFGY